MLASTHFNSEEFVLNQIAPLRKSSTIDNDQTSLSTSPTTSESTKDQSVTSDRYKLNFYNRQDGKKSSSAKVDYAWIGGGKLAHDKEGNMSRRKFYTKKSLRRQMDGTKNDKGATMAD